MDNYVRFLLRDFSHAVERGDITNAGELTRELVARLGGHADVAQMTPGATALYVLGLLARSGEIG